MRCVIGHRGRPVMDTHPIRQLSMSASLNFQSDPSFADSTSLLVIAMNTTLQQDQDDGYDNYTRN